MKAKELMEIASKLAPDFELGVILKGQKFEVFNPVCMLSIKKNFGKVVKNKRKGYCDRCGKGILQGDEYVQTDYRQRYHFRCAEYHYQELVKYSKSKREPMANRLEYLSEAASFKIVIDRIPGEKKTEELNRMVLRAI